MTLLDVTISAADAALDIAIENALSILLVSPPGVGKSALCAAAAARHDLQLFTLHASTLNPDTVAGIYLPGSNGPTHHLPGALGACQKWAGGRVLILEELGQAEELIQKQLAQIILDRRIGEWSLGRLPVLSCTNDTGHHSGVDGWLAHMVNRFDLILSLRASVEEWLPWAAVNQVPEQVMSYLAVFKNDIYSEPQGGAAFGHASPRSWDKVRWALQLPPEPRAVALERGLGPDVAARFNGFLRLRADNPFPSLQDTITAHRRGALAPLPERKEALIAWAAAMAVQAVTKDELEAVWRHMEPCQCEEVLQLFCSTACRARRDDPSFLARIAPYIAKVSRLVIPDAKP